MAAESSSSNYPDPEVQLGKFECECRLKIDIDHLLVVYSIFSRIKKLNRSCANRELRKVPKMGCFVHLGGGPGKRQSRICIVAICASCSDVWKRSRFSEAEDGMVYWGITSHSTQYRSFRRRGEAEELSGFVLLKQIANIFRERAPSVSDGRTQDEVVTVC